MEHILYYASMQNSSLVKPYKEALRLLNAASSGAFHSNNLFETNPYDALDLSVQNNLDQISTTKTCQDYEHLTAYYKQ